MKTLTEALETARADADQVVGELSTSQANVEQLTEQLELLVSASQKQVSSLIAIDYLPYGPLSSGECVSEASELSQGAARGERARDEPDEI